RRSWPREAILHYDFHQPRQDWYRGAKQSGRLHVTEPYYDSGGSNITMVSVTQPVYDRRGRFVGVAGTDLSLAGMRDLVRDIHLRGAPGSGGGPTGDYAYLVSRGSKIIAHPDERLMLRKGYPGADLAGVPAGAEIRALGTGFTRTGGHTPRMGGAGARRLYW